MKATPFHRFLSVLLLASAATAPAQVLLNKTFSAGDDGGFTATNENGSTGGPWEYNAAAGSWTVNGDDSGTPSSNELTGTVIAVPAGAALRVSISHRYSFETEWDGAVIQYSTDGVTYVTIPRADFKLNGYTFASLIGNHVLKDLPGFNGDSPGYSAHSFITSVAEIPGVPAAGNVWIRFLGAWDEGARGTLPNWEIDSVRVETLVDSDGDGLPDGWETTHAVTDPAADPDGDGLSNLTEYQKFLNPASDDTDGDGLKDGVESGTGAWVSAAGTGTDALLPDTDGDGLKDGVETNTGIFTNAASTGTNPHLKDTDGDLVSDLLELSYGSSPVNAASTPVRQGVPSLLAWFTFNDDSNPAEAPDTRAGFKATLEGGAAFTEDAAGHSGKPGDRAVTVPAGANGRIQAVTVEYLNIGARADKLTFTFWQRRNGIANSNSFWAYSPASADQRGMQAHAPWSDGTFYFDTAGCCEGTKRISGKPVDPEFDYTLWHHFAFVKNGGVKEVWVDGELAFSGTGALPLPVDFNALRIGGGASGGIDGEIDDFAVFGSALSQNDIQRLVDGDTPLQITASSDADADGLPDSWEYLHFPSDLTKLRSGQDFDNDTVRDEREFVLDTNPAGDDTDGDGVKDGAETKTGIWLSLADRGTDPKKTDTDGDGMTDDIETNSGIFVSAENPGTSPLKKDTDGDTFTDTVEILYQTSPVLAAERPFTPGIPALLAWWSFNSSGDDGTAVDEAHDFSGLMEGGALLTEDAGGRTGTAGDRALALPGRLHVEDGEFLNAASPGDALTVSFWQLRNDSGQSSFWAFSPGSNDGERGLQAHAPWTNGMIYFDSAGCCVADATRISGPLPEGFDSEGPAWHHYAFVKNGAEKTVWLDGDVVVTGTGLPLPADFYKLFIGSANTGGGISGLMDDFAVYAGGLSEAQITRLAAGEKPDAILTALPPAASFSITSAVRAADGSLTLTWESAAGTTYSIEGSANTTQWIPVRQNIAGAAGTTSFTLTTLPAAPYFLRIRR